MTVQEMNTKGNKVMFYISINEWAKIGSGKTKWYSSDCNYVTVSVLRSYVRWRVNWKHNDPYVKG